MIKILSVLFEACSDVEGGSDIATPDILIDLTGPSCEGYKDLAASDTRTLLRCVGFETSRDL